MLGGCKEDVCVGDMSAELKPDLQLEIAYLLLIDVVGYSKLLVNEQIELLDKLNRLVRSTASFQAAESNNKLIRVPTGDGMALIFFRSPEEPARCAIEISEALKTHPDIQLRMGVHSGPINQVTDVNDRVNVAGAGINVAQRVMDCADAGHILLTKHVADDLAQYRHWQPYLHDLGEYEVKHGLRLHLVNLYKDGLGNAALPEKLRRGKRWKHTSNATVRPVNAPRWPKWALFVALLLSAVALALSCIIFLHRGSKISSQVTAGNTTIPISEKSVAVLPFENLSEDKANAYFADGVQDEILTDLAKVADLKVISRTSVMQYKNLATRNLREIAQQLGVAHVLEGSVQRTGNRVRVSAQLIDARTDMHLWAEHYDRDLADVFAIQSEIAKKIADQLQAKISPSEKAAIEKAPTTDLAAFDLYERAKALWADVTDPIHAKENLPQAARLLDEAVARDPQFLLAWCLLSRVHGAIYWTGHDHTRPVSNWLMWLCKPRCVFSRMRAKLTSRWRPTITMVSATTHGPAANWPSLDARYPTTPKYSNTPATSIAAKEIGKRRTRNLERALELDPRNFFILQQLALTYLSQHRYAEEESNLGPRAHDGSGRSTNSHHSGRRSH